VGLMVSAKLGLLQAKPAQEPAPTKPVSQPFTPAPAGTGGAAPSAPTVDSWAGLGQDFD
jgi:hypothetical protein